MMLKMRRAEILASSSSAIVWPDVVMTTDGGSVRAIVRKLHVNAEVFVLQLSDDVLERVAIATGHADDVTLNGSLDLCLTVLNELNNFFGLFRRDAFLDLCALPHGPAGGRFNLAVTECFQRNATSDEFLLQDVVHVAQLCFVFSAKNQFVFLVYDVGRTALEVEALSHLFEGLVESICNLRGVDLGDD